MSSSGSRYSYGVYDSQVFVGQLPVDTQEQDVKDLFSHFGKIVEVRMIPGRSTSEAMPFAFVTFHDPRDARDAIKERDGFHYHGCRLRVERLKPARRGDGDRSPRDLRESYPRRSGAVRRSCYRVSISGLPASGSWQDLKNHMGAAGEVCFADVYNDGTGMVEYLFYDDMEKAVRKLDDTKFRSHRGDSGYIHVKMNHLEKHKGRSRSRSRSPARPKSRSPPPSASKRRRRHCSRSRSKSRSPSHSQRRRHSHSRRSRSTDRSDKKSKSGKVRRSPDSTVRR